MSCKKLLINTPKKIKDIHKPSIEFQNESKLNYYEKYGLKE